MGLSGPLSVTWMLQLSLSKACSVWKMVRRKLFLTLVCQVDSLPFLVLPASFCSGPKPGKGLGLSHTGKQYRKISVFTLHRSWDYTDLRGRSWIPCPGIKPGNLGKPRVLATRPPGTRGEKQKWPRLLHLFVSKTVSRRQKLQKQVQHLWFDT